MSTEKSSSQAHVATGRNSARFADSACSAALTRAFLVGCPRSGTTLVQRCIAANPSVASFPETDFFSKAIGRGNGRLRARMGRIKTKRRMAAFNHLAQILSQPEIAEYGYLHLNLQEAIDVYVGILDARAHGCRAWLEKTPKHFRYVSEIQRRVENAKFMHVVRDGCDTVASIVDLARRHPGFQRDGTPERAIKLWNDSVRMALKARGHPSHFIVRYEDFVDDPEPILARVCEFLGVPYVPSMYIDTDTSAIVLAQEHWKDGAQHPIGRQRSKFDRVFSPEERSLVCSRLDWATYERLFPEAGPLGKC